MYPTKAIINKKKYDNLIHLRFGGKNVRPRNAFIKFRKLVRGFPDDIKITVCEANRMHLLDSFMLVKDEAKTYLCRLFAFVLYVYIYRGLWYYI